MKLVYPIILYPMEEHEGGYTVEVRLRHRGA